MSNDNHDHTSAPEAPQVPAISQAPAQVPATTPPDDLDHECDESASPDIDLCRACGEHASYCSQCGLSNCCGSRPYMPD